MSEINQGADALIDESIDAQDSTGDRVGLTSDETTVMEKKSLLASMTIFDAMLIVSLICICLATLILFFELRDFGTFPGGFPWRTGEVLNS
jgi:hypothetical protein